MKTTEKAREIKARVRFGSRGMVENDLPKCRSCGVRVRFGFMLQLGPAAYQGEGTAEVLGGGKNWSCWVLCRKCGKEFGG